MKPLLFGAAFLLTMQIVNPPPPSGGGGGNPTWGSITGTLSSQTDLQTALDGKAASAHNHDGSYAAIGHSHSGLVVAGGTTGQVLKKSSDTNYDYAWAADNTGAGGGGELPAGVIVLTLGAACPAGFNEVASLSGKTVIGTLAASGDVGQAGGADNVTPTGTVSQPTFTGNALSGGARKGGTSNPASIIENGAAVTGTVSQPSFTGASFDNRSAFVKVLFCAKA